MESLRRLMDSPQDWETAAFFLLVAIFVAWERLRPARAIDRWADLRIDVLSFAFALFVNRISTSTVTATMDRFFPALLLDPLRAVQAWPSAAKIALSFVVADFVIYWIHRAQHKYDTLWRTHAWHHSIEQLYWFSGFRTSFTHSLIYNVPQAIVPLFLFQLSPAEAGIAYSLALLVQFWEHTNVRVDIGPLRHVFITPAYHRVHHSASELCRTNFGTTFSIWDRMFGTYTDPRTVPADIPLGLGERVPAKKLPRMLLGV